MKLSKGMRFGGVVHSSPHADMKSFVTSSKIHRGRIIEKIGVGSVVDFGRLAEKAGIKPTKGQTAITDYVLLVTFPHIRPKSNRHLPRSFFIFIIGVLVRPQTYDQRERVSLTLLMRLILRLRLRHRCAAFKVGYARTMVRD
jgi:hypothetical protein